MVAFLVTYFVITDLGRLLKRRAGVPLGIIFQIFCLTLAFYAAVTVYGVKRKLAQSRRRRACDFERCGRRRADRSLCVGRVVRAPKTNADTETSARDRRARHILLTLLIVLDVGYHAEGLNKRLLAPVSPRDLGSAAPNLLGSLVAGISLQISRPYRVGRLAAGGERTGEVMEINWRATRLRTNDNIYDRNSK